MGVIGAVHMRTWNIESGYQSSAARQIPCLQMPHSIAQLCMYFDLQNLPH